MLWWSSRGRCSGWWSLWRGRPLCGGGRWPGCGCAHGGEHGDGCWCSNWGGGLDEGAGLQKPGHDGCRIVGGFLFTCGFWWAAASSMAASRRTCSGSPGWAWRMYSKVRSTTSGCGGSLGGGALGGLEELDELPGDVSAITRRRSSVAGAGVEACGVGVALAEGWYVGQMPRITEAGGGGGGWCWLGGVGGFGLGGLLV